MIQDKNTPTTTVPAAPPVTIPGAGSADDKAEFVLDQKSPPAGGYDPAYKTPTTDEFPKTIYYTKEAMGLINTDPQLRGKQLSDALPLIKPIVTSGGGAGKKLPAYSVTNPADLRAVFKKTAQDLLGHTLGDGDLNRMVEAYQQKETTYQKAAYAGGGVNVSQAPNAQTFAQSSLENDFGAEVNTQELDGIFSSVNDMLMKGK